LTPRRAITAGRQKGVDDVLPSERLAPEVVALYDQVGQAARIQSGGEIRQGRMLDAGEARIRTCLCQPAQQAAGAGAQIDDLQAGVAGSRPSRASAVARLERNSGTSPRNVVQKTKVSPASTASGTPAAIQPQCAATRAGENARWMAIHQRSDFSSADARGEDALQEMPESAWRHGLAEHDAAARGQKPRQAVVRSAP
jgi:hypothetical protein